MIDFDQLLAKQPGRTDATFGWHQDQAYWIDTDDRRTATCWLAVDDSTIENGCLQFLPGSHRQPVRPHHPLHGDRGTSHTLVTDLRPGDVMRPVPIRAGDITVHSEGVLHGSGGNTTTDSWRGRTSSPSARPAPSTPSGPSASPTPTTTTCRCSSASTASPSPEPRETSQGDHSHDRFLQRRSGPVPFAGAGDTDVDLAYRVRPGAHRRRQADGGPAAHRGVLLAQLQLAGQRRVRRGHVRPPVVRRARRPMDAASPSRTPPSSSSPSSACRSSASTTPTWRRPAPR